MPSPAEVPPQFAKKAASAPGLLVAPTVGVTQEQRTEAQENVAVGAKREQARLSLETLKQALIENPFPEGQAYFSENVRKLLQENLHYLNEGTLNGLGLHGVAHLDDSPVPTFQTWSSKKIANIYDRFRRDLTLTAENPNKVSAFGKFGSDPHAALEHDRQFLQEAVNWILADIDTVGKQQASLDQPDDANAQKDAQIETPADPGPFSS